MKTKIQNAFQEVKADAVLQESTFEKVVATKQKKHLPLALKLAPVAALACVVFVMAGVYFTPISYISVDVNPSIELSVNRFDRVVSAVATNEDAQAIVEEAKLVNQNYITALENIEKADSFAPYSQQYTELTVVSSDADKSEEMLENISTCSFASGGNVHEFEANEELRLEAEALGVSFGKYRAYLELSALDPSVDLEDVQKLPMRVIREMIESHGGDAVQGQGGGGQHDMGHNGAGQSGSGQDGAGQGSQNGQGRQNRREE